MKKDNVIYYYTTSKEKKGESKICVAGVIDPETKTVKIGLAKCSPNDKFNKKKAQLMASGRAEKNPVERVSFNDGRTFKEPFMTVAVRLAQRAKKTNKVRSEAYYTNHRYHPSVELITEQFIFKIKITIIVLEFR